MSRACHLDWAVACRPLPGEHESGDAHCVRPTPAGWLLAVADGLGHGPGAADASRALLEVLDRHAEEPLARLIRRCHERLRSTRGAALSLAAIDVEHKRLEWFGVGNVEGVLRHAPASRYAYITQRGGIVGAKLPPLNPTSIALHDKDLLVFATDGIRDGFTESLNLELAPQALSARILNEFAKPNDDALVLVARWLA